MKIIKPYYEILTFISDGGIKELQHIEKIGRTCYKSENAITEDGESAKKFVKMLINNHHEAMLEHSSLSVRFVVDRAFTHELVRHRLSSFAQESQRYCAYNKDKFGGEITFIEPYFFCDNIEKYSIWQNACHVAEDAYLELIRLGAKPEEARTVLPNSTKTDITITANYREWRHILNLRAAGTTGKPHPQMIEIMIPLLNELQRKIPIVFDDIEVNNEN